MCSCHDVIMMLYSCRILSCLAAELHDAAFTSCLIYSNDRVPAGRKRFPVVIIQGLCPVFFFLLEVVMACSVSKFYVARNATACLVLKCYFFFFSSFFCCQVALCRLDSDNGFFGSALLMSHLLVLECEEEVLAASMFLCCLLCSANR